MTDTSPSSSAPSVDWTPETIQSLLLAKLELAFTKHFQPADKCPSNRLYLGIVIRTHFHLEFHVARELAEHTTTLRELLDQLTALLFPNANLFTGPSPESCVLSTQDSRLFRSPP